MATQAVNSANLGERMFEAASASLGGKFSLVRHFLKDEAEKLAITLRMIMQAAADGEISKTEAKILLNQQKLAASAVLTSAEGMTAVAVQAALNAALKAVKDFVNDRIGFRLV